MQFKRNVIDKRITAEDYHGKPCTLTPYARFKIWKARQPKPYKYARKIGLWASSPKKRTGSWAKPSVWRIRNESWEV